MHNTASTSKAAYSEHVSSGNKHLQRMVIMKHVSNFYNAPRYEDQGGFTRRQIAKATGFELGATAGRVNLLIKDGLLVDKGTTKCTTTGKTVGLVGLPEKQGELI